MNRLRTVISIALLGATISMQGCYSSRVIMRQELEQYPQGNITTLYTRDSTYHFDDYGRGEVVDDTLVVGRVKPGVRVQIPLRDVVSVQQKRINLLKTGLAVTGIVIGAYSTLMLLLLIGMDR